MIEESKKFSFSEIPVEEKKEAEFAKDLLDVANLFTQTGAIFDGIRKSEYAPDVKRLTAAIIMEIALTDPDAELVKESIEKISNIQNELQGLYWKFLMSNVAKAAAAIQSLPPAYLFESSEFLGEDDEAPGGIKQIEGKTRMLVKPCDSLMALIAVGIAAAGSEAEFSRLQVEIVNAVPSSLHTSTAAVISMQITGALIASLAERSKTATFASTHILSVIQMVNAAQRCTALPFIADWSAPGIDITERIVGMALSNVESNIVKDKSEYTGDAPEEKLDAAFKETSTAFTGNKTVN